MTMNRRVFLKAAAILGTVGVPAAAVGVEATPLPAADPGWRPAGRILIRSRAGMLLCVLEMRERGGEFRSDAAVPECSGVPDVAEWHLPGGEIERFTAGVGEGDFDFAFNAPLFALGTTMTFGSRLADGGSR